MGTLCVGLFHEVALRAQPIQYLLLGSLQGGEGQDFRGRFQLDGHYRNDGRRNLMQWEVHLLVLFPGGVM